MAVVISIVDESLSQTWDRVFPGFNVDGEITRARASVLARMVLRENAKKLYGL